MPAGRDAAGRDAAGRGAPRRVVVERGGPTLVEGPISLEVDGADPVIIDRFLVAVCSCKRSATYPLCDGTHRTGRISP